MLKQDMVKKQFVWIKRGIGNELQAQIWHEPQTVDGKPVRVEKAYQITEDESGLSIDDLSERYPKPTNMENDHG